MIDCGGLIFVTLLVVGAGMLIVFALRQPAIDDRELAAFFEMVGCKLDRIITMLEKSKQREKKTMADLSALQAEVERNGQVDQSAIALLQGLAATIEELKGDPAALQAFVDQLRGSSDALAAAVQANTPAA